MSLSQMLEHWIIIRVSYYGILTKLISHCLYLQIQKAVTIIIIIIINYYSNIENIRKGDCKFTAQSVYLVRFSS
jgi:uncharacterized membrane protein